MRATGSPLFGRAALGVARLLMPGATLVACGAAVLLPDMASPRPGDLVGYSEDRIGRPWRVVEELDLGRYLIRNGRATAVADLEEIGPYEGVSAEATAAMAGVAQARELEAARGAER
jgi:hypothetical protein